MHINNLPPEVIRTVLSLSQRESLAPASLVCKAWRTAALPILYRSVRLFSMPLPDLEGCDDDSDVSSDCGNHPEDLISQVVETNDDGLGSQLANYVRRLSVGWTMDEEQLQTFGSAVSKMKNLEHISWIVSQIHDTEWHDTLVKIYEELPDLRSLILVMAQKDIQLGDSDEVVSLANLKDLAIEFDEKIEEEPDFEVPTNIINLICGAHNIESLSLDLEVDCSLEEYPAPFNWGPDDIFSALSSPHFPHLRKLYIGSYNRQTSLECFTRTGSGLRQLLGRQQLLHTILLYIHHYITTVGEDYSVSPRDIEELLPSIRHFGGPVVMVEALLKSRLASQIEALEIIQLNSIEGSNLPDLLQELDNPTINELSNLKGLSISTNGQYSSNNNENTMRLLAKLVLKAPALEELIISATQLPSTEDKASLSAN